MSLYLYIKPVNEQSFHGFCYGYKFAHKQIKILRGAVVMENTTKNTQAMTAEAIIGQAKAFSEDFGIDAMPKEIYRDTEASMKWLLDAAEHGTDIITLLATNAPDYNKEGVIKAVKSLCSEYNSRAKHAHYNRLMMTDNPIMAAVYESEYTTIKYSESQRDDVTIYGISEAENHVDLETLYKHCERVNMPCGATSTWKADMDTILMVLVISSIKRKIPDDAEKLRAAAVKQFNDSYKVKEISAKVYTDENISSNNNLINAVKDVMRDMFGEEKYKEMKKPLRSDLYYLQEVYCKPDPKVLGGVIYVNSKEFSRHMLALLRRVIRDIQYPNKYKTKKVR